MRMNVYKVDNRRPDSRPSIGRSSILPGVNAVGVM
jgi:hypothetical protein